MFWCCAFINVTHGSEQTSSSVNKILKYDIHYIGKYSSYSIHVINTLSFSQKLHTICDFEMEYLHASLTVVILALLITVESASYDISSNLSTIPQEAFPGDPELYITNNQITRIPRDAFLSYTNLKVLYLVDVGLRYIEDGAFNGQDKLERFTSRYNWKLQLPGDLGPPTKSLVYINWWQTLPYGFFTSPYFAAFDNLTSLNIGGNWLSTFQPNILPKILLHIHLGYNTLHVFPKFAIYAPLLEQVVLYNCGMHTISIQNVTGLTEVRVFDLTSNKLTDIPNLSFMGKLETLKLRANQLSSVPDMYDLPLESLTMADNPLVCNKALCWVRMWPWMKASSVPEDEPVCAGPDELAGVKLMDVDPTFMECFQGGWLSSIII